MECFLHIQHTPRYSHLHIPTLHRTLFQDLTRAQSWDLTHQNYHTPTSATHHTPSLTMARNGNTPARSTTSTNLSKTAPTSFQGIANLIITALTDATIWVQDKYQERKDEAQRRKGEEDEWATGKGDEEDEVRSLIGDREAEEGQRHQD
jgi:hypothetical protein